MESILSIINYFKDHMGEIALAITSLIGTASIIVKLTPTPKDDAILKRVKDFISKFIALNEKE